ncbi:hypothetical protein BDV12DRAFT_197225 [Aspergillus spectabilis]
MSATPFQGPEYITAALTCTNTACKAHIDNATVSLFRTDQRSHIYDTQYNPLFLAHNPHNPAIKPAEPVNTKETMTPAQRKLYKVKIDSSLQPETMQASLFPKDSKNDMDDIMESPEKLHDFARYKLEYHIYMHYMTSVQGISVSDAAAEIEMRRWQVRCEMVTENGSDIVGERRGAISLE